MQWPLQRAERDNETFFEMGLFRLEGEEGGATASHRKAIPFDQKKTGL
jgi:hypothetical protein